MINNKRIGILTWHYYPNFGSALQSFYAGGIREEEWTKPYELTKMSIKKWVNSVLPVWIRRLVRMIIK